MDRNLLFEVFDSCDKLSDSECHNNDILLDMLVVRCFLDETLLNELLETSQFDNISNIKIEVLLRILKKELESTIRFDPILLENFIIGTSSLLSEVRPHRLIWNLFKFYSVPNVFDSRPSDSWRDVIRISMNLLSEQSTTKFIRTEIRNFLNCLQPRDARRFMIISGILQTFVSCVQNYTPNCNLTDETTSILSRFVENLELEECWSIVDCVRSAKRLGAKTINLVVTMQATRHGLEVPVVPGSWENEKNRIDYIVRLLNADTVNKDNESLVTMACFSPSLTLLDKCEIIPYMNDTQKREVYSSLKTKAAGNHKFSAQDTAHIIRLLKMMEPAVSVEEAVDVLKILVNNTQLLNRKAFEELFDKYNVLMKPPSVNEFYDVFTTNIMDWLRSKEWERVDTALEAIEIFPIIGQPFTLLGSLIDEEMMKNPYVLGLYIKIMISNAGGFPLEMAIEIMKRSPDPYPKHICMKYLLEQEDYNNLGAQIINDLFDICMSDDDNVLRDYAIKMVMRATQMVNIRDNVIDHIRPYRDDEEYSDKINSLCGTTNEGHELTVNDIQQLLKSLVIHRNPDDTMDCY